MSNVAIIIVGSGILLSAGPSWAKKKCWPVCDEYCETCVDGKCKTRCCKSHTECHARINDARAGGSRVAVASNRNGTGAAIMMSERQFGGGSASEEPMAAWKTGPVVAKDKDDAEPKTFKRVHPVCRWEYERSGPERSLVRVHGRRVFGGASVSGAVQLRHLPDFHVPEATRSDVRRHGRIPRSTKPQQD